MIANLFRAALLCLISTVAFAQPTILWEAFNDYRPGAETDPNATTYDLRITDDGGVLRNIATGADLEASVVVVAEGDSAPDDFGANAPVNVGSPAYNLFNGKVTIGNDGLPGIRNSANVKIIINFTGLDPSKRYNFRGTVSRGGSYNDRWSVYTISGADAYVHAHEDGSANKNIFTEATFPAGSLETNQVALNSGENKVGSLVGFDNIEPGADGTFAIEAQQYVGTAPFGNPSAAAYGYGFNAIYLAKIESTGNLRITENPANKHLPAGTVATLSVVATSPQTITYQWQKTAPGTTNFTDIAGATQSTYNTPALTVAESGTRYRVVMASGSARATSGEATVTVDGSIPTITGVRGSINFNSVYLTFSEPMNLETLRNSGNYTISGGLTVSAATDLDSSTVRLTTSAQTPGTRYTITANNIQDVAGNKIANNSAVSFTSFSVVTNTVGLEIWKNILGGGVVDLTNNVRYPNEPDVDFAVPTFDSIPTWGDFANNTYGGRMRAWLTPTQSGEYEFFLRADDQGEFRISMDDKFDNMHNPDIAPDATDATIGDTFQEPGIDSSTSIPIQLVAGRRYAIQTLFKESNGNDHLQLAWRRVGDATPADQLQPIPSNFLSFYGPSAVTGVEPRITRIALEGGRVVVEFAGTLQSSTNLQNWTDEASPSPASLAPDGSRKFFRARQ